VEATVLDEDKIAGSAIRARDRREEIDELMRIKQGRRMAGDRAACPACGVIVENAINRCPFCESDITAEMALARETTRRLRELSDDLDAEHALRAAKTPKRRGFFSRLKYLFGGDPKIDPSNSKVERVMSTLSPGESLTVVNTSGPWVQVKTAIGEIGWLFSTVRKGS
jgi:hypothetical protein